MPKTSAYGRPDFTGTHKGVAGGRKRQKTKPNAVSKQA